MLSANLEDASNMTYEDVFLDEIFAWPVFLTLDLGKDRIQIHVPEELSIILDESVRLRPWGGRGQKLWLF